MGFRRSVEFIARQGQLRTVREYRGRRVHPHHDPRRVDFTKTTRDKSPSRASFLQSSCLIHTGLVQNKKKITMSYLAVGKENGPNIEIYYNDWETGHPVVSSHGPR